MWNISDYTNFISKTAYGIPCIQLVEQNFSAKMTNYEKLQSTNNSKSLKKQDSS